MVWHGTSRPFHGLVFYRILAYGSFAFIVRMFRSVAFMPAQDRF